VNESLQQLSILAYLGYFCHVISTREWWP